MTSSNLKTKVSIVVLSWNNWDKTVDCLNSILETNHSDFEIILVDNGSSAEVIHKLKKNYGNNDKITLIFNGKNLGSAEGRNVGFRSASRDSKYIAFFDNDTIMPKEYIGQLIETMETHEDILGVNGAFYDFQGEYPSRNTSLTVVSFDAHYIDKKLEGNPLRRAVALTGSGCMYNKDILFPQPFYDKYFFGGEEVYLGLLVYLKGGTCAKVLNAPYQHLSQNTFQKTKTPLASYHATKNRLMSLFLFFEAKTLVKLTPLIFISQIIYFLYFPRLFYSKLKAYWWLLANTRELRRRRKVLQGLRKVGDEEILKYMSGQFQDINVVKNKLGRTILKGMNKLFLGHCKLFNIKTREFYIDERKQI